MKQTKISFLKNLLEPHKRVEKNLEMCLKLNVGIFQYIWYRGVCVCVCVCLRALHLKCVRRHDKNHIAGRLALV